MGINTHTGRTVERHFYIKSAPGHNGHLADDICERHLCNWIKVWLKFISEGPINNTLEFDLRYAVFNTASHRQCTLSRRVLFWYIWGCTKCQSFCRWQFRMNVWISFKISQKFVPNGPTNNKISTASSGSLSYIGYSKLTKSHNGSGFSSFGFLVNIRYDLPWRPSRPSVVEACSVQGPPSFQRSRYFSELC